MSTMEDQPQQADLQPTHKEQAALAVRRVADLVNEALLKPNSTTMNERAETVKSWVTPILDQNDHKTAEVEVNRRGLNDRPHRGGISIKRRYNPSSSGETNVEEYWMDPSDQRLYKLYPDAGSIKDSDRFSRCHPVETIEVMDEFGDIIDGALHPEKQASRKSVEESVDASSSDKDKQRGRFLTRLARRVFDPSKVFPTNRAK
ncbi:MAG TPA: hypothetical protein PKB09_03925 [Candidatus Saccharibacteria bacterium]|nr:hypothetical protein [Candidatus Saccharibacteria bacterium]